MNAFTEALMPAPHHSHRSPRPPLAESDGPQSPIDAACLCARESRELLTANLGSLPPVCLRADADANHMATHSTLAWG